MKSETAFYTLLMAGAFLSGLGHYIIGPIIIYVALSYRSRFEPNP